MGISPRNTPVRLRIAPSPTGNCHVGTARSALYNLLYARPRGGAFVLRSDDTDARRSTIQSEQGVLEGLRWLGLHWDEGPDVGGPYGPYRQSERLESYRRSAEDLLASGRAYHCFCTPEEHEAVRRAAQAGGRPPVYSGRCRTLAPAEVRVRLERDERGVVRLRLEPRLRRYEDLAQGPIEQDGAPLGDPVIVRADGLPTYNFATVVDDHEMRISHVLRAAEHISNTFVQLQVYASLGWEPPAFGHLALLLNPDRSKISKRTGAVYIGEYRDRGTRRLRLLLPRSGPGRLHPAPPDRQARPRAHARGAESGTGCGARGASRAGGVARSRPGRGAGRRGRAPGLEAR